MAPTVVNEQNGHIGPQEQKSNHVSSQPPKAPNGNGIAELDVRLCF